MTEVAVTVASGTALNQDQPNAVLSITVTNTDEIPAQSGTNAYYYVSLTDGANTEAYTFSVGQTGTIPAAHQEIFVVENTALGTITDSSGVIHYTAA